MGLAPALAEAGLDTDRLEAMAEAFDDRSLACGLEWLAGTLDLLGLASEIETSTGRISELVGAMKEYTYMDRAAGRRGRCDLRPPEHHHHPRPQAEGRLFVEGV